MYLTASQRDPCEERTILVAERLPVYPKENTTHSSDQVSMASSHSGSPQRKGIRIQG